MDEIRNETWMQKAIRPRVVPFGLSKDGNPFRGIPLRGTSVEPISSKARSGKRPVRGYW